MFRKSDNNDNMKINILAFGVAKDILGSANFEMEVKPKLTIDELKAQFLAKNPDFSKLNSILLAINSEYSIPGQVLKENDEVALIPPVSGG